MSVATMMATLKLNIQDFSSKLDTAAGKLAKFANNAQQDYGKAATTLKSHNLGLKDTARIVQGIVISQAFYSAVNAISSATSALWSFNKELDYAKITYTALFSSSDLAGDFSRALQEHAVETIFDYQQLSAVSKKLLAYGIEYKNLMFVMEGLTNLGAMSGDPQAMDRIGLALGQIQTTGYLTATEMRQLANAYVPIYDIVQEAFGLNGKQMQNIGDLKIPAHDVINAIVDYANTKFGAVGDAATYTITGIENRIVDTLKTVGSAMIEPITTAYKSLLVYIADGLGELRNAFDAGGLGGVFEHLVPDERAQTTIRQFIANVANLLMSLASAATVAANLFGNVAQVFVTAFNIVAPVISNVVNVLSAMTNAMLQNSQFAAVLRVALVAAAGAFVLMRVQAAAALVVTAVTKAVTVLSGALVALANIIRTHPLIALLSLLGVSIVGVSVASNKADKSISGLFDRLSDVGGLSSKDILQPVKKDLEESAKAADAFNNRIDEGAKVAEDMKKKVGKAAKDTKKALGLLSFDEVFKLPEKTDPAGSGSGSNISVPDIGDYGGFGGLSGLSESLIPDIPDFSEYISAFTDGLFGGLSDNIKEKLKSIGIGSLIGAGLGAIIGGLIGGPAGAVLGMKIGAFAGGFAGLLWDWLKGALSNTGIGAISGIAAAISKAFGGEGIATIFKTLVNAKSFSGFFKSIGEIFSATGLKSIAKGGLIGAAIGLVVDSIAHLLWNWMADSIEGANAETAKVGQTIGSVLGSIIGAIIGGPPGAMIGSAIGTFVGGLVGLFWEPIAEYFDPEDNALSAFFVRQGEKIKEWAVFSWETLSTWAVDTATSIAVWATDTWSKFSTWWNDTKNGFLTWYNDSNSGFSEWLSETVSIFSDWSSINSDTLKNWFDDTKQRLSGWWSDTKDKFTSWFSDTFSGFTKWYEDTWSSIDKWATDTIIMFGSVMRETLDAFYGWTVDIAIAIKDWVVNSVARFKEWKDRASEKFSEFSSTAKTVLTGFIASALLALGQWGIDTVTKVRDGLNNVKTTWNNAWTELGNKLTAWFEKLKIAKLLNDYVWKNIADFFNPTNFWNRISGLLSQIKNKFSKWWSGLFDSDVKITGNVTGSGSNAKVSMKGHATGGVFNREHIARFAEGNRAEAIIPLENDRAMQPFVDAVSNGLVSSLAPIVATLNSGNSSNLPPLYVGTLIADDRGIKQLYDKFEVIRLQESDRRGTTYA